jgi:Xaa-Pro aminopeptidase
MIQNPFTRQVYDERLARIHQEIDSRQLDLLILNDPESIYYASGFHRDHRQTLATFNFSLYKNSSLCRTSMYSAYVNRGNVRNQTGPK